MPTTVSGTDGIGSSGNLSTGGQILSGGVNLISIIPPGIPPGAIMPFAVNTTPEGWLQCNGDIIPTTGTLQGVASTLLQPLRNLLGTTHGSLGQLPDLRGYFIRGFGTNSNTTTSLSAVSGPFGQRQTDEFERHTHGISARQDASGGGGGAYINYLTNITVQTQAAGESTETRPKNIALLYCIKY